MATFHPATLRCTGTHWLRYRTQGRLRGWGVDGRAQQSIKREGFDEDGGGGAGPGPVRLDGDDDEPDDDSGDLDDLDDLLG